MLSTDTPRPMRWPLRLQLLLPMIAVLVLAIGLLSAASAYMSGQWVQRWQQQHLDRLVATIANARFPLTPPVITSLKGLTGAEFVAMNGVGQPATSTLPTLREDSAMRSLFPLDQPGEAVLYQSFVHDSTKYLVARVPLRDRSRAEYLYVLMPETAWWSEARQLVYPPLISGAVAFVVLLVTTTAMAGRMSRPIGRLSRHAERIASGDFSPAPMPVVNDEIRDLTVSINGMSEQLRKHEDWVRRTERLRTLDQLSSGLAHQLRNSVTGARMAIELHRGSCCAPADDDSLQVALQQLSLMENYLQRFLTIGKPRETNDAEVGLDELLQEAVLLVQPACVHAGIGISIDCASGVGLIGDAELLKQMLLNLLLNAIEAAGEFTSGNQAGRIEVKCSHSEVGLEIEIGDTGRGPPAEIASSLFEPFVTCKADGTGLGLAVARQIAEQHGGTLQWHRSESMTWFSVKLPITQREEIDGACVGNRR